MSTFETCMARARSSARLMNKEYLVYKDPHNGQWSVMAMRDVMKEGVPITHWRVKVYPDGTEKLVGG